jgi:hypothetical protein
VPLPTSVRGTQARSQEKDLRLVCCTGRVRGWTTRETTEIRFQKEKQVLDFSFESLRLDHSREETKVRP